MRRWTEAEDSSCTKASSASWRAWRAATSSCSRSSRGHSPSTKIAVLAAIVRQLARHAIHLAPFMPNKAQELWTQIGGPGHVAEQRFAATDSLDVTGWRVAKGPALFPKPQPAAQ